MLEDEEDFGDTSITDAATRDSRLPVVAAAPLYYVQTYQQ